MRRFNKIGKALLLSAILLITMLYFLQEKLIFLSTKLPIDHVFSFSQPFEEIFLTSKDGAKLNAVHFKQEKPKGLILYFHGNAGDLSRWGTIATFFVGKQYDVIIMDYRTYGKSTGKLSESALHEDAQLFYDYALKKYDEQFITLYGRSLGTGIAIRLASNNKPSKLILETPFYSLMDVAKERFPFLPVKWLLQYKLLSFKYVGDISCPITVFHGTNDDVVPYESGKRLFVSIPNHDKKMYTIEGGEHNNLVQFKAYLKGVQEVLK